MDQSDYEKMLVEVHGDLKATKALMESFVYYTFPEHLKEDKRTERLVLKVSSKVNKIFWSVGGAIAFLAITEGAKAMGWLA